MQILKMNFSLTEKIEKKTKLSVKDTITILKNGTEKKFQFFPDQIMKGKITTNFIEAVINPPIGLSDGFKSKVTGRIINDKTTTHISLIVKPSLAITIFIVAWCLLIFLALFFHEYSDTIETLKFLFITIAWTILPFALCKLKVNWDKRRLEKWIETELSNTLYK